MRLHQIYMYIFICVCVCVYTTTWMNLEGIMLREIDQRQIQSHLYVTSKSQNKENNGNTHMENKLLVSRRMEVKGGVKISEWV